MSKSNKCKLRLANRSVLNIRMPVDGQTTESIAIDATAVTMEVTLFKEPLWMEQTRI